MKLLSLNLQSFSYPSLLTSILGTKYCITYVYNSLKHSLKSALKISCCAGGLEFNHPCSIGSQSMTELLMYTIPFLDTVAGEALSMLCGSKTTLQFGAMGIRSPLARVKVLLSSSTLLRFSIQMASTGPSRTIQMCSPCKVADTYMMNEDEGYYNKGMIKITNQELSTCVLPAVEHVSR